MFSEILQAKKHSSHKSDIQNNFPLEICLEKSSNFLIV